MSEERAVYGGGGETFEPPRDKVTVTLENRPPAILIASFPIEAYADNAEDGVALLHGKLREIEALAMRELVKIRARKAAQNGIIRPGANGLKVV